MAGFNTLDSKLTAKFFDSTSLQLEPSKGSNQNKFKVDASELLLKIFQDIEPAEIQTLLARGSVYLNNSRVEKNSLVIEPGSLIRLYRGPVPDLSKLLPKSIVYQDKNIVVINKPPLLHSVPALEFHSPCLISEVKSLLNQKDSTSFLDVCHRLDFNTSGLIVLGKSKASVKKWQEKFKDKKVQKYYLCLLSGVMPKNELVCESPILTLKGQSHDASDLESLRELFTNSQLQKAKESKTIFYRLLTNRKENVTLALAKPVTGRTHQIRLHAKVLGFPFPGDRKYGVALKDSGIGKSHYYLHATRLDWKEGRKKKSLNASLDSNPEMLQVVREFFPGFSSDSIEMFV